MTDDPNAVLAEQLRIADLAFAQAERDRLIAERDTLNARIASVEREIRRLEER